MIGSLLDAMRPMLLTLDPERAHELSLRAFERGIHGRSRAADPPTLRQTVFGLDFPNPVGIAAGFDKDARVPDAVLAVGCGFAEIGTVTPRPQTGKPTPRLFRLVPDRAVINRLGFNNGGHAAALARLRARPQSGIVGVNIGANKDTEDKSADYATGIETFDSVASYFTVNISSPNTPGLRDLQAPAALDALLKRVMTTRARLVAAGSKRRPVIVKLSPDVAEDDLPAIVTTLLSHEVDGIAVSNTTLARPPLSSALHTAEAGGLSGRPLFQRSTVVLARVHRLTGGRVPLIGIGGIDSPAAALAKIEAGATLIQLYTGLVYEGMGLIGRIKGHLADVCANEGISSLTPLVGRHAATWAARDLAG